MSLCTKNTEYTYIQFDGTEDTALSITQLLDVGTGDFTIKYAVDGDTTTPVLYVNGIATGISELSYIIYYSSSDYAIVNAETFALDYTIVEEEDDTTTTGDDD